MKRFILAAFAVLGLGVALAAFTPNTAVVFADAKADVCAGLQATGAGGGCAAPKGATVDSVIKAVINILSWVVGIISVIMIIVAGFKYVTSGGDSNNVQSAKNTIIYALVGILIVALSQTIVKFVIEKLLADPKEEKTTMVIQRDIENDHAYVL